MPTLQQVKNTIDTYLTQFWPLILANQEAFLEPRFFQGLELLNPLPLYDATTNGAKKSTLLDTKPSDRDVTWNEFNIPGFNKNTLFPCGIQCDEYLGPDGKGWQVLLSFNYDTGAEVQLWAKVKQSGPETWREHDWTQVEVL